MIPGEVSWTFDSICWHQLIQPVIYTAISLYDVGTNKILTGSYSNIGTVEVEDSK